MSVSVELHLGDCLEYMQTLPDGCVDMCLTSPPYNLGNVAKGSFWTGRGKGDTISYDAHDDDMPDSEYEAWQHEIIREMYRVLKDGGAIFYNHKPRILNGVLDDRKRLIPLPIRQEIIWDRCAMVNFSGSFYAPNTERIYIIAKGEWKPEKDSLGFGEVWRIPAETNNEHPAPFPLRLAKRAVVSGCDIGGTVLDPFAGSATTAIACIETGRNFVGCEKSPAYHAIAQKRIAEAQMQLPLLEVI